MVRPTTSVLWSPIQIGPLQLFLFLSAQQYEADRVHTTTIVVRPSPSSVLEPTKLEMDLDWPVIPIHLYVWNHINSPLTITWKGKYRNLVVFIILQFYEA